MHPRAGWHLVLPVKGGPQAKSRLGAGDGAAPLALAMALDCLDSALSTPGVARCVVVTGDDAARAASSAAGAVVVRQDDDAPGLASAVAAGLRACTGPTAVLLADLPAVRPRDLRTALDAVERALADGAAAAFVPDAEGTGTVLLAGDEPAAVVARFGAGSAAAHEGTGARRLDLDLPRLRRDVDTGAELRRAVELGVGRHTAARLLSVQTTVLTFDRTTGRGTVVTDDGVRLQLAQDALAGSGLLHLRPGQRVTCERTPDDPETVSSVRIHGISV